MAADFAGACEAIEERLDTLWTETPKAFEDDRQPDVTGADRELRPWVLCEILTGSNEIHTAGPHGKRVTIVEGTISLTLFSPRSRGKAGRKARREMAERLEAIFRDQIFFKAAPGVYVRTWMPVTGPATEAVSQNPSGNWWATSIATPFQFFHRA